MKSKKDERIGDVKINKDSLGRYEMKIVEYKNYDDIIVEFQDKYRVKVHTTYNNFKKGKVKNPYYPSVCDIGYVGEGRYKISENGKPTKIYDHWRHMLMRCYDPYYLNKETTYVNCYVCEEWHNFQKFAQWWEENYYECNNEKMNLDKDILCKGNKIYSPEMCCIIPQKINNLFIKSDASRGKYPIGVSYDKTSNKFRVYCSILDENNNKNKYLGRYDSVEEAFLAYKIFKESYIKEIADKYKDLIPQKLYDALYRWEVEIDD